MEKITIQNKRTGSIMDVTPDKWRQIQATSRNWEKIASAKAEPKGRAKKAQEVKPEEEEQEQE